MKQDNENKAWEIFRWMSMVFVAFLALSIFGCAAPKTVTEYRYINVPVKCELPAPIKPIFNDVKAYELNLMVLKYTEELEATLRGCYGRE